MTTAAFVPRPAWAENPTASTEDRTDEAKTSSVGRKVEDFTLRDYYGKDHSLADYDDKPLIVMVVLGTECPLAKIYGPRLAQLHDAYRDRGVAFIGVNANAQDSPLEIQLYAERHGLDFPILKDLEHSVVDQLGAVRTPEVYVLDSNRTVRYAGRIDDQYGIGYQRPFPEQRFVAEALDELLAGRDVSTPLTESIGCFIGRVDKVESVGDVTYASHIAEILNQRCVECHRRGEIAPFPLETYEDTQGWGETMLEVVDQRRMPPWNANPEYGHFRNDARLSPTEVAMLHAWVKDGMPSGDLSQQPAPPTFTDGWRIPTPDLIIPMREEPYAVPAEGVVDYQYFEVDPGFTEDKYIWAAEARPGNSAVVHHIIVFIKRPGQEDIHGGGMLAGYAPGSVPRVLSDGLAMRVPAGSKLIFELHYTPNGAPETDLSRLGIKFIDKDEVRQQIRGGLAINQKFVLEPGKHNVEVVADRQFEQDIKLLNMTPHMHLRGKAFRYEAHFPDGRHEVLLDVPKYDFNWQLTYELESPRLLPKGTTLHCVAHFDNSEDNPANPAPEKAVRWGQQSWDEMMIGFFEFVPVR